MGLLMTCCHSTLHTIVYIRTLMESRLKYSVAYDELTVADYGWILQSFIPRPRVDSKQPRQDANAHGYAE